MRVFFCSLVAFFCFFVFSVFFTQFALAATTPFRSASVVTSDGFLPYTNLESCSDTDGSTCDRGEQLHSGFLHFKDFGRYDDFGMPSGSKISHVRMRITGKASTPTFPLLVTITAANNIQANCMWIPTDVWTLGQLAGNIVKTQTFLARVTEQFDHPAIRADCLEPVDFENNTFMWNIVYSQNWIWSANIDNFEIAFDYSPPITPTPTPSPTPVPGPEPFLDLPWNYEGKGLTFNEAALSMTSYFDHTYPLLGGGLSEHNSFLNQIITFMDENSTTKNYSSHDGYDYAIVAKVNNGDSVLAVASGCASYNLSPAEGNVIKIDHGNYYQTRYLHLQDDGLVTKDTVSCVNVLRGQQVGLDGRVSDRVPRL